MPGLPHLAKSSWSPSWADCMALVSSFRSTLMSPAPMLHPKRVPSMSGVSL